MPTETGAFLEHTLDVLAFVAACHKAGDGCALGVVTRVTGGSARALGTLFAVRADGTMAGYVSHGCIDADLIGQAQAVMGQDDPLVIVYGANSPFFDLKLPCGGTVELLVDPSPDPQLCQAAYEHALARQQMTFQFDKMKGFAGLVLDERTTGWAGDVFNAWQPPQIKLVVAGVGPPLAALCRLAGAMGVPVTVLSPDKEDGARLPVLQQDQFHHLTSQTSAPSVALDPWTAVLLVFHDHDWEASLLMQALESEAFYIGALGSARTHANRLETLKALGVSDQAADRIVGPIGLLPSARDAHTLALSALAEIVARYRQAVTQASQPSPLDSVAV